MNEIKIRKKEGILIIIALIVILLPFFVDIYENGITGNVISTVNITGKTEDVYCNMTLYPGWNLVSFYCIKNFWNINSNFFTSINNEYSSVFTYDSFDQKDPWISYKQDLPPWVYHELNQMVASKGYWVHVTETKNLVVNGTNPGNTTMSLAQGWNLIGYPSERIRLVSDVLAQIQTNYTQIWMYTANDSTWYVHYPSGPGSTFNYMVPDFGYWIYITSNSTLVIDW